GYGRDVEGLRTALDYRPDAIREGRVDRVRVEARAATVGELRRESRAPLRVRDVRLDVEGLLINPQRLLATGALEILDADALRIEALEITQADLDAFLRGQPTGRALAMALRDGWAHVTRMR